MATFPTNNAAIVYVGYTELGSYLDMVGAGSQVWFRVFGKTLQIHLNAVVAGTDSMEYSIDGGATFTNYNFGATGAQTTTDLIAAGSDGFYDIVLRVKNGQFFKLFPADAIQVLADGTPLLLAPTDNWALARLSNTSVVTALIANATLGANKKGHTCKNTDTSYGHFDGGYSAGYRDAFVVFRASCTKVAIYSRGGTFRVYRDGVAIGSVVANSGANYNMKTLVTGEDGAEHEYRVVCVGIGECIVYQVAVAGTFSTTAPTLGRRIAFLGDSTTACTAITNNSDQGFVSKIIGQTSIVGFNRGISGDTTDAMNTRLAADVLAIASMYAVVVISGANDTLVSDATLQATCQTLYGSVLSDDAATLCLAVETLPSNGLNREGPVQLAAVTAIANANCLYYDTDGWMDGVADTHDGQHLNNSGGVKVAAKLLEFLNPAAATGHKNMLLLGVG